MHTFYTIRYPPPTSQKKTDDSQSIRVTDTAIESLLFCIVHSIEFQTPLLPFNPPQASSHGAREKKDSAEDELFVRPVENSSTLLGNVTYVARSKHNPSVLVSLRKAVEAANAIRIPEGSNEAPFELQVRILRNQRGWVWTELRPLVEWVFRIVKTRKEFSFPPAQSERAERQTSRTSGTQMKRGVHSGDTVLCSNDPEKIRQVLQFILKHSYDAIDLNTYADFRSGELVFDVSVREVS